jgi:hypothetical protein
MEKMKKINIAMMKATKLAREKKMKVKSELQYEEDTE